MSIEFIVCIITLFFLAGIGTPIAYSIILASIAYLFTAGQGIGILGKVLMDGLYQSFILLAVPLFIVAANIMIGPTIINKKSLSESLIKGNNNAIRKNKIIPVIEIINNVIAIGRVNHKLALSCQYVPSCIFSIKSERR